MNTSPFVTPEMEQLRRDTKIAKAIRELVEMHDDFTDKVGHIEGLMQLHLQEAQRIKNLPKGDKGDRGERGLVGGDGRPGKDGKDGRDGKDAIIDIDSLVSKVLSRIKSPKDGKDAVINEDALITRLIEKIKEGEVISMDSISGLRNELSSYRNQLAGKHYGKNTWARGGGDTIAAGTNVTITVDEQGNKVISAQGGSAGAPIKTETVVATAGSAPNSVDIDLTQLSEPWQTVELVIRNGVIQNQNKWSIAGDVLTLTGAIPTNDYQLQYTYATP